MFGLDFLFASALFALPVAGLPVLLHLLFRKKSPVVAFSTLRFVKSSMQRTAARRKLQRWLLLACRALLLLLLIWAIAQPAHRVASNWLGSAKSPIAAIVIDTSYSMELRDNETPLLEKADTAVQSLLRDQLRDARVAIFKSLPPPADHPETLVAAGELAANWVPLSPTPAPVPLAERISAATSFLANQQADQKWLFVLTDFQVKEFPRPVQPPAEVRAVFIDLHSDDIRSAGITRIQVKPDRPIPGVGSEAVVSLAGRTGDSRAVTLRVADTTGKVFGESTLVATLDRTGHGQLRFPLKLPAERWVTVTAAIPSGDASAWDDQRTQLIEVPPRRTAVVLPSTPALPAERFVRLALDPSEGSQSAWPISMKASNDIAPDTKLVVSALSRWPDAARAKQLRDFAKTGGTVVLFLSPGMEQSWPQLPNDVKSSLLEILPGTPEASQTAGDRTVIAATDSSILEGLTDASMNLASITVRRFVPIGETVAGAHALLSLAPAATGSGSRIVPLVSQRPVGAGQAFAVATLPDLRFTNLPTHPLFLPMMVRIALAGATGATATNVEVGSPIVLRERSLNDRADLNLETPKQERFVVPAKRDDTGVSFVFAGTESPGVYTVAAGDRQVALANVQLPGDEAEPDHRDPEQVVSGENVVVTKSVDELASTFATLSEPEPRWTLPIAIVLMLLCFEALMGSVTTAWRWPFAKPVAA